MEQNIKSIIITTGGILGISLSVFFLTFIVLAWTGPQHTPPTCEEGEVGCEAVIHTGASAQEKLGGLLLNSGGAEYGLIVENGKVGIGTTTPSEKLTVEGIIESSSGGFKFPDDSVQTKATKLLNSYFAITPATRQTISSITPTVVTGLSVTLTPVSSDSKFLILATINGSHTYVTSFLIYRNGTPILSHTGNSNEPGSQATMYDSNSTAYMRQQNINYMDSPGTSFPITYDVRVTSGWEGTIHNTYVNDRGTSDMRTPSTLTILEFEN